MVGGVERKLWLRRWEEVVVEEVERKLWSRRCGGSCGQGS